MPHQDEKCTSDTKIGNLSDISLPVYIEDTAPKLSKFDGGMGCAAQASDKNDEALDFLASVGNSAICVTAHYDARVLRIIDRNIMPIMFVIYFLQMMDKQTISLSSVFGLSKETGLEGEKYSLIGAALYISHLVCLPISAYFLVKVKLSIYVPTIVTCWGITLTCMAAARTFSGLLVSRLFLGVFEASIQGAFVLTAQTWYRRREQGIRLAIWYSTAGIVNIFGTLAMFGIGHIQSATLYTYQIVSLLLGAFTVSVGLLSYSYFPNNPVQCKFLADDDKIIAIERIRSNQQGLSVNVFKFGQVWEMITDVKSWCWMGLAILVGIPAGGISVFGPLIIKGFGFSGDSVMLLLMPYGVLQIAMLFFCFWANHKFNRKWAILMLCILPCLTASVILRFTGRAKKDQPVLLLAYYMLSASVVPLPTILNWQSSNVAGQTKKTATTAFNMMGTISGYIIGPLLFSANHKPFYHRGLMVMIVCFSAALILVTFTVLYLMGLNEWNRKRRIVRGKAGKIVDYSMLDASALEKEQAESEAHVNTGRHAFDDLTDLKNDEFIYVY